MTHQSPISPKPLSPSPYPSPPSPVLRPTLHHARYDSDQPFSSLMEDLTVSLSIPDGDWALVLNAPNGGVRGSVAAASADTVRVNVVIGSSSVMPLVQVGGCAKEGEGLSCAQVRAAALLPWVLGRVCSCGDLLAERRVIGMDPTFAPTAPLNKHQAVQPSLHRILYPFRRESAGVEIFLVLSSRLCYLVPLQLIPPPPPPPHSSQTCSSILSCFSSECKGQLPIYLLSSSYTTCKSACQRGSKAIAGGVKGASCVEVRVRGRVGVRVWVLGEGAEREGGEEGGREGGREGAEEGWRY